ncbi:hypothetical protein F0241_11110 [Vibrio kanaloae]|uniref:putative phage abortive infection protein n=1 Tax=Vibrio kanaloae TaxID=170673 RepID=UPI00148E789B|nr:hypothetical protein [Vibrio kanaloae]
MIRALKRTIQKEHTKLICAIGFTTLAVGMPYVAKFWGYQLSTKTSDWGSFGSYIGGLLSPLFAVGSLYYVVKTFRQQSFETTFNLLLEQHNSLANSLSTKQTLDGQTDNPTKKSTSPIEDALGEFGHYWLVEDPKYRKSLNDNYDIHKYVRVVYQILKFIDDNCPTDKLKYSRIFRSFISNDLNLVLALNSAQRDSSGQIIFSKYKRLIEKYHLLEHLILLDLAKAPKMYASYKLTNLLVIAGTYTPSAFGDRENIKRSLEVVLEDYHSTLSYNLLETSKTIRTYKKRTDFVNQKLPRFISLLEEHANLGRTASNELIKLNLEYYTLVDWHLNINEHEIIPKDFTNRLPEIKKNIEGRRISAHQKLKHLSFYNAAKLASTLCEIDDTTALYHFLDGIMHTISTELKLIETEVQAIVNIT